MLSEKQPIFYKSMLGAMETVKKLHSGNEFIHGNNFLDSADTGKQFGTHGE